ncbi:hypothetical protein GCM10029976_047180 [Kribbella albertanoniae]|uniref:Uncharacterized protein n=1 Tax=Kribbella albertanoniae TaxID=1266829 RepID=A0A4R4QAE9_9ACTN|nr:hypothetical protein [Kribbella albertanoniae]TDC32089.1 hypothetical protein E1261_09285 [Kribbella albertanoniae]
MTDPDSPEVQPPPGNRRATVFRHLDRLNDHPVLKTLIMISEIAALIGLIAGGIKWIVPDGADEAELPTVTSGTSSTPRPSSPSSTPVPSTAPEHGCWTSRRTAVDCREPHRYEEIPQSASCDHAAVIGFLGGQTGLDVTVAKVAQSPAGRCAVDAGREVSGSARDALQGSSGAAWRRCVDRRVTKNVACSALHSGEYVATGSTRRASDAECQLAAARYLDQVPGALVEDLEVRVFAVESGTKDLARCIIDARGNHLLTTSVRNLGTRPVPIHSQ